VVSFQGAMREIRLSPSMDGKIGDTGSVVWIQRSEE
jgi:hypothetical protein